jgi:hypothetical protein
MMDTDLPPYVRKYEDKYYCWLTGEMDKMEYSKQCSKCPLQSRCKSKRSVLKDVPGDWHSLNAEGFFGVRFTECKDAYTKKTLRGLSKIGGLLLTYGGTAWNISHNFNCTQEEAQVLVDNFFRKLTTLKVYMSKVTSEVLQTGMVENLFGRQWDVSADVFLPKDMPFKEKNKLQGHAKRHALNHPIQSAAAEFLKLGSLRADHVIRECEFSPYSRDYLPLEYATEAEMPSYEDFGAHLISSIHDELMYLIRDDCFEAVIPKIYIAMQLQDIMELFGAGFTLEMDCEFDQTRSWTAGTRFDSGRIYMLREIQKISSVGGLPVVSERGDKQDSNLALVSMGAVTPEVIGQLQGMTQEIKEHPEQFEGERFLTFAVVADGEFYPYETPLPISMIERLNIDTKLGYYAFPQPD